MNTSIKRLMLLSLLAGLLLPTLALAQTVARATFAVTKFWEGTGQSANTAEVEVTISCNTGLPLEQTAWIDQSEEIVFVVESFDEDQLDCTISELDPPNYESDYLSFSEVAGNGSDSHDDDGCYFDDFGNGDSGRCEVFNIPENSLIEITKSWVIESSGSPLNGVSTEYCVTLHCTDHIVDYDPSPTDESEFEATWCLDSDAEQVIEAEVEPGFQITDVQCSVSETVYDSSVEAHNSCGNGTNFNVIVGQDYSCTITNTVFFEGIPALNSYGLAVLMLSMLGLGFFAYRRFA